MLVRLLEPDPILRDDPVRPRISPSKRIDGMNRAVFAWVENRKICAIACVSYQQRIPTKVKDLLDYHQWPTKAILYSVWSYKKGSASKLIQHFVTRMKNEKLRIITISPKTEMARNFHLKNGAKVLKTNRTTINYEY